MPMKYPRWGGDISPTDFANECRPIRKSLKPAGNIFQHTKIIKTVVEMYWVKIGFTPEEKSSPVFRKLFI